MSSTTFDVVFRPPALANQHLPIQLTGPGTFVLREDGFDVTGAKVASKGRNAIAVLGFFIGFILIIVIGVKTGINVEILIGIGIVLGGIAYGIFNKMPVKEGEIVTYSYDWSKLAKIKREPELMVIVMKKSKPKGAFYIETNSHLEIELNKHLQR